MTIRNKFNAKIHISGAGVVSVNSSEIFSSEQEKPQIDALKKIHDRRKHQRAKKPEVNTIIIYY